MPPQTFGDRLEGQKTYLCAIGFGVLGGFKAYRGAWEDAAELALVAMATASLRHAIARKPKAAGRDYIEDHD